MSKLNKSNETSNFPKDGADADSMVSKALEPQTEKPKEPTPSTPKLELVRLMPPTPPNAVKTEAEKVPESTNDNYRPRSIDGGGVSVYKPKFPISKPKPKTERYGEPQGERYTPRHSERSFVSYEPPAPAPVKSEGPSLHPISEATEALQFRAIGVIRGKYVPSEENITKGHIEGADGTIVDAVLLGKVISIIKKRLDIANNQFLWVVYPRTNDKEGKLHVQITGVWAPQELGRADVQPVDLNITDGYFSIRGEVSAQSIEDNTITIKIRRTTPKLDRNASEAEKAKAKKQQNKFKLLLQGILPEDAIGQFWSINVQRQGDILQILDAEYVGIVPRKPFKRKSGYNKGGGSNFKGGSKFGGSRKPFKRFDSEPPSPIYTPGEGVSRPIVKGEKPKLRANREVLPSNPPQDS
jgi:hypothetical protein